MLATKIDPQAVWQICRPLLYIAKHVEPVGVAQIEAAGCKVHPGCQEKIVKIYESWPTIEEPMWIVSIASPDLTINMDRPTQPKDFDRSLDYAGILGGAKVVQRCPDWVVPLVAKNCLATIQKCHLLQVETSELDTFQIRNDGPPRGISLVDHSPEFYGHVIHVFAIGDKQRWDW